MDWTGHDSQPVTKLEVAEGQRGGVTLRDGLLLERDALERPLARAS